MCDVLYVYFCAVFPVTLNIEYVIQFQHALARVSHTVYNSLISVSLMSESILISVQEQKRTCEFKAPALVGGVQGVLRCTVPLWERCWRDCRWGTWLPTSLHTMAGAVFVTTETIRFLATFLSFLAASKIKSNDGIPAVGWKGECLWAKCRQRLCRCEKAHGWGRGGGIMIRCRETFAFLFLFFYYSVSLAQAPDVSDIWVWILSSAVLLNDKCEEGQGASPSPAAVRATSCLPTLVIQPLRLTSAPLKLPRFFSFFLSFFF